MSELYKDKIEVSLDGRQVFYLFFGGAIITCMVFVLGVLVGKRVEARAHLDRAATTAARDPLAALDRLAADGPRELSFRQALTGGAAPASEVERTIAEMERARGLVAPEAGPQASGLRAQAPEAQKAAPDPAKKPDEIARKPDEAKPVTQPSDVPKPAAKPKGKFTLQLSAFQDKTEAESFLADIKGQGYDAFIVEAVIPERGTFYRVRVGSYATYEAAVDAKMAFERKVKKIAYVSRI